MEVKNEETIKQEINNFVQEHGGDYPDYYIGITQDVEDRKKQHIKSGWYTEDSPFSDPYWKCENNDIAVRIERHFQKEKGMKGLNLSGGAEGTEKTIYVYCFKLDKGNKKKINETQDTPNRVKELINYKYEK